MDKGEILEVVKDLTKSTSFDLSNTDDARMNALVTEAELHIFKDVPLAENSLYTSNLIPFQTADVHASLYHLPAGYQKVISVSQSGYQLNPMPPSTNSWTRRYPGRLVDFGYDFFVVDGVRYLGIVPYSRGTVEMQYLIYEPSINSGYDADTGSYKNPLQTNKISERYPQLYYTRIAFLVSERDLDEMAMARFLSKYNAESELARTEEAARIRPVG